MDESAHGSRHRLRQAFSPTTPPPWLTPNPCPTTPPALLDFNLKHVESLDLRRRNPVRPLVGGGSASPISVGHPFPCRRRQDRHRQKYGTAAGEAQHQHALGQGRAAVVTAPSAICNRLSGEAVSDSLAGTSSSSPSRISRPSTRPTSSPTLASQVLLRAPYSPNRVKRPAYC